MNQADPKNTPDSLDVLLIDDKAENIEAAKEASETFSDYTFAFDRGVVGGAMTLAEADVRGVGTDLLFGHPIGAAVDPDEYSVGDVEETPAVQELFDNWLRRMPKSYGDVTSDEAQAFLTTDGVYKSASQGMIECYQVLTHMERTLQDTPGEEHYKQRIKGLRDNIQGKLAEDDPVAAIMGTRSAGRLAEIEARAGLTELPHGVATGLYAAENDKAWHVATSAHRHQSSGTPIASTTHLKPMVDHGHLTTDTIYAKGAGSPHYTQTEDKSDPGEWEGVIDDITSQL